MFDAYEQAHTQQLWETAYWVSNMISVHTKKGVRSDKLMKPFIKKKTAQQKANEAEEFFARFEAERKALEKQRKGRL